MYINSADLSPSKATTLTFAFRYKRSSKRCNLRVRRLCCRRRRSSKEAKRKEKAEMELKNLRLYRENQSIIIENEKLRRKAKLLHQENQALLFQLRTKSPSLFT